jgi:hypothetical protein
MLCGVARSHAFTTGTRRHKPFPRAAPRLRDSTPDNGNSIGRMVFPASSASQSNAYRVIPPTGTADFPDAFAFAYLDHEEAAGHVAVAMLGFVRRQCSKHPLPVALARRPIEAEGVETLDQPGCRGALAERGPWRATPQASGTREVNACTGFGGDREPQKRRPLLQDSTDLLRDRKPSRSLFLHPPIWTSGRLFSSGRYGRTSTVRLEAGACLRRPRGHHHSAPSKLAWESGLVRVLLPSGTRPPRMDMQRTSPGCSDSACSIAARRPASLTRWLAVPMTWCGHDLQAAAGPHALRVPLHVVARHAFLTRESQFLSVFALDG